MKNRYSAEQVRQLVDTVARHDPAITVDANELANTLESAMSDLQRSSADRGELPPLKWSILRYGFSKEDHDGEKEAFGGRDRREAATG